MECYRFGSFEGGNADVVATIAILVGININGCTLLTFGY